MENFDLKYLAGLKMTGATLKEGEKDGRKTKTYIPYERPAKEEDVLGFKDYGAYVVVAIKDGKKYKIEKNPRLAGSKKEAA